MDDPENPSASNYANEPDELNEPNELNEPRELNETTEPRELSEPIEPGETGLRDLCSHAVVTTTQHGDGNNTTTIEGVYTNFRDALTNLKSTRLEKENGWIAPINRGARQSYPYRHRIGQIWSGDQYLGWGYASLDPGSRSLVNCVWIARTRIWTRVDESTIPTWNSDDELDLVGDTSDVVFDAFGRRLPGNARFGGNVGDAIFPGEEGSDREGDQEEISDRGNGEGGDYEDNDLEDGNGEYDSE